MPTQSRKSNSFEAPMLNDDNKSYYKYTGKQRVEKAVHTLEGLLKGAAADGEISLEEVKILQGWVHDHYEFKNRHPFSEILPVLSHALIDATISQDERDDLLWLCTKYTTENDYFDVVTSDMQRLQGLMVGISFDGQITVEELGTLQEWLDCHEHLRKCWPYDELEGLILSILNDGKIDKREHDELLAFFADFAKTTGHQSIALPNSDSFTLKGVCAVCPEVSFRERTFCFTGESERMTRTQCAQIVEGLGGNFWPRVTLDIHYLVVGANGNPCWAYACYGRKIEQAVRYRKDGHQLLIVHEHDFWDSVEEHR